MRQDPSEFAETTIAPTPDGDPDEQETGAAYLLILLGESSSMRKLPASGAVVLGRSQSCDMQIEDAQVSRQHARIELGDGEAVLVDLESKLGTQVNGQAIAGAHALFTGDIISMGSATIVYRGRERAWPVVNVLEPGRFRDRLREELERALRYTRPFAVACLDLGAQLDRRRVVAAIGRLLRRMDAVSWAGDGQLFLVLPESDATDAEVTAAALIDALAPLAAAVRVGHAVCPDDGADVDTLLADARHAALGAEPGRAARATGELRRIQIGPHAVVVADAAMARVYALLERLAPVKLPVLITGETGTGKELAARALHEYSPRREARFAAVNCAALPESLIESELFGHERGAFSGAVQARRGLLEDASGGTVFLDEIGEMPLAAQAKLLRVLETGQLTRLGDLRERPIDIRLVAATHRNLHEDVRTGRFREDLFFRLGGAHVRLPALRERPGEIVMLGQLFLDQARERAGLSGQGLSHAALETLLAHPWTGNVRELRNLMEYVAATCPDPVVEPWHLESRLVVDAAAPGPSPAATGSDEVPRFRPLAGEVRELEERRIREALEATGGNQTRAAALLSVPLRTFYDKVKALGITPRRKPS